MCYWKHPEAPNEKFLKMMSFCTSHKSREEEATYSEPPRPVTLSEETTLGNLPHGSIWYLGLPYSSCKKLGESAIQGNTSKNIHWSPRTSISEFKSLTHLIWCEFPQDPCTAVQSHPPYRYRSIPSGKLKKLHFESSMFIPQYLWWDKFSWGPLKWWTWCSSAHWCTLALLWTLLQAESTCPGTWPGSIHCFLDVSPATCTFLSIKYFSPS